MKRLLISALLVAVGIVGFGFYRGWFTVNQDKIQQDEAKAKEKVLEFTEELRTKASEAKDKAKEAP